MGSGWHPIQSACSSSGYLLLHRMCGASYCPATAYTTVHGYAPSCTWRVIAGTSHPEHEHVIFVHLEIWHPRSHPTSGSWTSQILDIQILDISDSGSWDLEIWRVSDLDLGVQTPRDPPDTPKTPLLGVNSTAHWHPALAQNPFVRRQMGARLDAY